MPNNAEAAYIAQGDNDRAHSAASSAVAELSEINECECSMRTWEHITNALRLLRGV